MRFAFLFFSCFSFLSAGAGLVAQSFQLDRKSYEFQANLRVNGAWGPAQIPIQYAEVAAWYKTLDTQICPPSRFVWILQSGDSPAFSCKHGVMTTGPNLAFYYEGASVNLGLLLRYEIAPSYAGIQQPNQPPIADGMGGVQVFRGLAGVETRDDHRQNVTPGQYDCMFLPDFSVRCTFQSPQNPNLRSQEKLTDFYLVDYFLNVPQTAGSWMRYYDVAVSIPQRQGGSHIGTLFQPENFQSSYQNRMHRYGVQTFLKIGTPDSETFSGIKIGFFRKDWDSIRDVSDYQQLAFPCTFARCAVSPFASLPYDMTNRYSKVEYSSSTALPLPARLHYYLADRDITGQTLEKSGVTLHVTALRNSDGMQVQAVDDRGKLLKLDGLAGESYSIKVEAVYGGVTFSSDSISPSYPLFRITKKGGDTIPGVEMQEPNPVWNRYTVGQRYQMTTNSDFDAFPVFNVYFRKPADVSANIRFVFDQSAQAGGSLKTSAKRKFDGWVIPGTDIQNGQSIGITGVPGQDFELSLDVVSTDRPNSVRVSPLWTLAGIDCVETGEHWNATDSGWKNYRLAAGQRTYKVRMVTNIRPVR